MRITIDNADGTGAVDYTAAVSVAGPITIERKLNKPSICRAELALEETQLATPVRRGRVSVCSDAGAVLFTGYLATEPATIYEGEGLRGPVYRTRVEALSDEWVLDRGGNRGGTTDSLQFAVSGAGMVAQLTEATEVSAQTGLVVTPGESARALGSFAVTPSANWSTNAAAAANATYSSLRVVNGAVQVQDAGVTVHSFEQQGGSLALQNLTTSYARELANDVTLTGAPEAAAFVQEVFHGDGSTSVFTLSRTPFRGAHSTLIQDAFDRALIDATQWTLQDSGGHVQLSSAGLTCSGGTGFDGQTLLEALNTVEMSGFVLAELGGVLFGDSSDGMLASFYSGEAVLADCFAGFRVRQSSSSTGGVTVLRPVIQGIETGQVFTPVSGHRYTLRLRLYCSEIQRVAQRYFCMSDGVVNAFGDTGGVSAPMHAVFEVLDEGASSNTPASVLYDTAGSGGIADTPAMCAFVALNSTNLYVSVAAVEVTRPGSAWVVSTLPNGVPQTRLLGSAGEGVDCELGGISGAAKLTFFDGRIPQAGERVTVHYRTSQRSVARLVDASSIAAEQLAGAGAAAPGVSRWLGRIGAPLARSSADCEAAAQAVLSIATARSAALHGSYSLNDPAEDIWPGDVLTLPQSDGAVQVLVRSVVLEDGHAAPELVSYRCSFANDWATEWADGLGLQLSDGVAEDAVLPQSAELEPASVAPPLQNLTITALDGQQLQIDTGAAPVQGGGFEVRRRDGPFGMGLNTPDLVLRSPVESFSLPRAAQVERYFIRMYDASTPPRYSRFSSAVFVNWPAGA